MRKIGVAVLLGAVLGAFDGLTAWFEPSVRPQLGTIVMLSSLKSVIAGLLIGLLALKVRSRVALACIGLAIGLCFAFFVARQQQAETGDNFYAQIMIPGSIVGLIVGYATARYGDKSAATAAA